MEGVHHCVLELETEAFTDIALQYKTYGCFLCDDITSNMPNLLLVLSVGTKDRRTITRTRDMAPNGLYVGFSYSSRLTLQRMSTWRFIARAHTTGASTPCRPTHSQFARPTHRHTGTTRSSARRIRLLRADCHALN
jgi:hypothetical protein